MKKILPAALILFALICLFTACQSSDKGIYVSEDIKVIDFDTTRPTEKTTKVRAEKNIRISVPSDFVRSEAGGDVKKYAATYGYEIKEDSDGNMTMKMNGRTYSLMLSGISLKVMISLGDIIDSGEYPYLVKLGDYSEDFSYILMLVNQKKYEKANKTPSYKELADIVGLSGLYYQYFTKEKDNRCQVILADSKTGEIVYRDIYTD